MTGRLAHLLRRACLAAGSSVLLAGATSAWAAQGGCLGDKPLRGVNIAGGEFNSQKIPGKIFKDYTYPTEKDLRYFAEMGANTVRVPFRWERVQRILGRPLDTGEIGVISKMVSIASGLGMCVILDAHNFGTYATQPLGTPMMPLSALGDLWVRMNEAFPDPANVAFGLMNEPAHVERADWAKAAQEAVNALRKAGSKHLLFVSGGGWSGAHDWAIARDGLSNAEAFAKLSDPLRRSVIEVHQYADTDSSGTKSDCIAPDRMRAILDRIAGWARTNKQKLFLGEFGVAAEPASCLETLRAQIQAMRDPPWVGWTYWAAGAWWGPSYIFNVHPMPGQPPRPQLDVLREEWK
jgi:endoglucanase